MGMRELILDAFQALGIILVFVTLLFSVKYPVIMGNLEKECPAGDKARKRFKAELKYSLVTDCLPVLFLTLISLYVLLPLASDMLKAGEISLWDSDMLPTTYLVITLWLLVLSAWVVVLNFNMIKKIWSIS